MLVGEAVVLVVLLLILLLLTRLLAGQGAQELHH
jgi:hypothetical protein